MPLLVSIFVLSLYFVLLEQEVVFFRQKFKILSAYVRETSRVFLVTPIINAKLFILYIILKLMELETPPSPTSVKRPNIETKNQRKKRKGTQK